MGTVIGRSTHPSSHHGQRRLSPPSGSAVVVGCAGSCRTRGRRNCPHRIRMSSRTCPRSCRRCRSGWHRRRRRGGGNRRARQGTSSAVSPGG
eukprot:52936-Eustigmatos_ZCMA.PRE.1